jgi:ribosomal-protein-serine acetyltransferase
MQFDHYTIQALRSEDLDLFFQLIDKNRPRLEGFFAGTVARTRTREDTARYVEEIVQKAAAKTYLPFLLFNNDTRLPIGFMDVKNIDWHIPKGELGFFMDESYAGKGIAAKALELFCTYCFTEMGFNKLFLRTHESNKPARNIAEKSGFLLEGTLRHDYKNTAGELVDLLYYGKLADR